MSFTENWRRYYDVNKRLPGLCGRLCDILTGQSTSDFTTRILCSYVRKAQQTIEGVNCLQEQNLWESAQILTRVLFELYVNYAHFGIMYQKDRKAACDRLVHCKVLRSLKLLHTLEPSEEMQPYLMQMASIEAVILRQYGETETKMMRKCGFTGLSLDKASEAISQKAMYDQIYRSFSDNVHSTDYVEMMSQDDSTPDPDNGQALAERNELSALVAGQCVAYVIDITNRVRVRDCDLGREISDMINIFWGNR